MSLSNKSAKKAVPSLLHLTAQSHYRNREVVKHYSNMTMQKAFESKSPSIGLLSKNDETKTILCITNLFRGTALYFDSALSNAQADIIADEILAKYEYRSLKIEDILTICIRLKESEIYKLTPARILREVNKYSKEREKLAINQSLQKSESNKTSVNTNIEGRLKEHFKFTPNADRLALKRNKVKNKFK